MCCFSLPLLFATGFFLIEANVENDGVGEIMVDVISRSSHDYLDTLFVSSLECVSLAAFALCPHLPMGRFSLRGGKNTELFPRDKMQKAYIEPPV